MGIVQEVLSMKFSDDPAARAIAAEFMVQLTQTGILGYKSERSAERFAMPLEGREECPRCARAAAAPDESAELDGGIESFNIGLEGPAPTWEGHREDYGADVRRATGHDYPTDAPPPLVHPDA